MHCCIGNATRAIYYIWESILNFDSGRLSIDLLMNRASTWADINSHLPYNGRVDVSVKQPVELSVRIPEWVRPDEVTCSLSGQSKEISWDGRCANIGKAQADDTVTLEFPITERAEWIHVEKRTYRALMRGSTCVAIDPPGGNCPLFQREHLRENATRWRQRTRFVPDEEGFLW